MNKNFLMLIMMLGASLGGYTQHSDDGTTGGVEFDVEYNLKEPEAVDMGGSVLWASFNLWAEKPTDVGGYCGWGDPTGELRFQADDPDGENYMDEETCIAMYGGKDPDSCISGTDIDVVHRQLGMGWQMPRKRHFDELHDCKWELTRLDGTLGYKVTAKNGNSIFLPAWNDEMGYQHGIDVAYGRYWTYEICHLPISENVDGGNGAYSFDFVYTHWWLKTENYDLETVPVNGENYLTAESRWHQLMIRPVKPKKP